MKTAAQPIDVSILRSMRSSRSASVFSPRHFDGFGSPDADQADVKPVGESGQNSPDSPGTLRFAASTSHHRPDRAGHHGNRSRADGRKPRAVAVHGAYAANALGLSDQVPAKIVIQTDGVPRRVSLGKLTLLFRRVAPRNLFGAGRPAGLVIQAIRHLRNDPDISRHIARLKKRLDAKTKADLKSLVPKTPVWMRPAFATDRREMIYGFRSTTHTETAQRTFHRRRATERH